MLLGYVFFDVLQDASSIHQVATFHRSLVQTVETKYCCKLLKIKFRNQEVFNVMFEASYGRALYWRTSDLLVPAFRYREYVLRFSSTTTHCFVGTMPRLAL